MRRWELAALAVFWAFLGGVVIAQACGHVQPPPPADCATACDHLQALGCSTSADLCLRLCTSVDPHAPGYASCVAAASSCAAADGCQ